MKREIPIGPNRLRVAMIQITSTSMDLMSSQNAARSCMVLHAFIFDYLRCEYHEFNRGEDVFDYARARRFSPLPEPSPERYDY